MENVFSPSDFVAVFNQTLEYAYPNVIIEGELANFKVSKGKWVYFDLKDEMSSVRFFGTIYSLPGPLEDGMLVRVTGQPRLHQQFGFSINVQTIKPVGEGSINKAAKLLQTKLEKEGLFDPARKRLLPYPPEHIGLVASKESAAFADFMKIINARWGKLKIDHVDVQVQGEQAQADIVKALEHLNQLAKVPEVIVLTRGGGSADDLATFSSEQVTRAVAASRVPTLVAVGHEIDVSLAELAADKRASTPSNAAELLVPDKKEEQRHLAAASGRLISDVRHILERSTEQLSQDSKNLSQLILDQLAEIKTSLQSKHRLLSVLDPQAALKRGYAVVRSNGELVKKSAQLKRGDRLHIILSEGAVDATVDAVE